VQKNLQVLGELQEIDLRLDGIAGDRDSLIGEMTVLDQQVAAARQDILAKEEELSSLDAEKQGFEETLAAESENIVRSEARLKEIKTQKEYLAVSKEITAARKMKGELEEQLLQKIGQLEGLKSEVAEQRGNLAQLEGNIAAQKAEVQGKVDALDHGLAEDRLARDQKAASLPAAVLKRYVTLRSNRRGLAVAEARDGSCLGCNMNIPPQLFNTLYRGTELITCPHCQRMLILKQQSQG
jgi:predicted  nucleic acid-binding Zn-ribbon protein